MLVLQKLQRMRKKKRRGSIALLLGFTLFLSSFMGTGLGKKAGFFPHEVRASEETGEAGKTDTSSTKAATLEDLLKARQEKAKRQEDGSTSETNSSTRDKTSKEENTADGSAVAQNAKEQEKGTSSTSHQEQNLESKTGEVEKGSSSTVEDLARKEQGIDGGDKPKESEAASPFFAGQDKAFSVYERDWDMTFTANQIQSASFSAFSFNTETNEATLLLSKGQTQSFNPSSFMTLFIAEEAYESLKDKLNDTYTFQGDDRPKEQEDLSYLGVQAGDTMKVEDLFYALIMGDGAEAYTALARLSENNQADFLERFVKRMNQRALAYGLTGTKLHGLYGAEKEASITTSQDLALWVGYMLKKPFFQKLLQEQVHSLSEAHLSVNMKLSSSYYDITKSTTFRGQNHITGGLPSWSPSAKFCLMTIAPLGKGYLVSVSSRANDNYFRLLDHTGFYASGFNRKYQAKLYQKGDLLLTLPVQGSTASHVDFYATEDVTSNLLEVVGKRQLGYITSQVDLIKAPQKQGSKVGDLIVTFGDDVIFSQSFTLEKDIAKYPLFDLNQIIYSVYFKNPSLFYVLSLAIFLLSLAGIILINRYILGKKVSS